MTVTNVGYEFLVLLLSIMLLASLLDVAGFTTVAEFLLILAVLLLITSMMFLSSLLMLSSMICKRPKCVGGLSFLLLLAFLHVPGGHAIAVVLVVDFC